MGSQVDWVFQPMYGNQSRRRKTEFKPVVLRLKFDLVSHSDCGREVEYIHTPKENHKMEQS